MSKFAIACRGLDCLMAIDAERGYPRWLSTLREGVAWPSGTPRNFATEPAVQYDFQRWCEENIVVTDDQQFEITFYRNIDGLSDDTERYCGILSGIPAFTLGYASSGYLSFLFGAQIVESGQTSYLQTPLDAPLSAGLHTAKVAYIGTQITGWLDDVLRIEVNHDRGAVLRNSVPISDFDGNIISMSFTNLTTGAKWSYPTWSEKTRLLTCDNVRTDRGVIEAADTSTGWSIKTPVAGQTVGTIFQLRNGAVDTAGTGWTNATGTLAGGASDVVSHVAIFNRTLTAAQIAGLTRTLTPAETPEIPADGADGIEVSGAGYAASNGIFQLDDPLATGTARTWHLDADNWVEWTGGHWVIVTDPDPEAPFTGDPEAYVPGAAYIGDASADPWDCVWMPAHQGETFPELDLHPAPTVTQVFGIEL